MLSEIANQRYPALPSPLPQVLRVHPSISEHLDELVANQRATVELNDRSTNSKTRWSSCRCAAAEHQHLATMFISVCLQRSLGGDIEEPRFSAAVHLGTKAFVIAGGRNSG